VVCYLGGVVESVVVDGKGLADGEGVFGGEDGRGGVVRVDEDRRRGNYGRY